MFETCDPRYTEPEYIPYPGDLVGFTKAKTAEACTVTYVVSRAITAGGCTTLQLTALVLDDQIVLPPMALEDARSLGIVYLGEY